MEHAGGERPDSLGAAYDEQTKRLHETRVVLAEAVAALRLELEQRREEATALGQDNRDLRRNGENLTTDSHKLREQVLELNNEIVRLRQHIETLDSQLEVQVRSANDQLSSVYDQLRSAQELIEVLRNMKVVRWTVWPRHIVYRMRDRYT